MQSNTSILYICSAIFPTHWGMQIIQNIVVKKILVWITCVMAWQKIIFTPLQLNDSIFETVWIVISIFTRRWFLQIDKTILYVVLSLIFTLLLCYSQGASFIEKNHIFSTVKVKAYKWEQQMQYIITCSRVQWNTPCSEPLYSKLDCIHFAVVPLHFHCKS